ncbi:hypothetical protein Tco_1317547 [Tanacetum coccineum]
MVREGSSKDGDEVGSGIGKSGGVLDGGVSSSVGEYDMWRCGDDHGESGDGGGVGIARSLATSVSDQNGVGGSSRIDILVVTQYAGCGWWCAAAIVGLKRRQSPQQMDMIISC